MKKFTTIHDTSNPQQLIQAALDYKQNPMQDAAIGKGKTLVLLFFNPSLRTRLSTQKAAQNLGMNVITMNAAQGWKLEFEDQIMNADKAEHIKEAAAVISQYADVIGIRTFPTLTDREKDYKDFVINQFIKYASVPVISLESAIRHPLQSLADMITIEEHRPVHKPKVVLTWAPHPRALPQAVANSFLEWSATRDFDLVMAHPKGLELAAEFSTDIPVIYNQQEAFEGADFIYVKNWSSYEDYGKITTGHNDWTVNKAKLINTNQAKVMHCLPVRRDVVIGADILDSPQSLVIEQANNRTYAAQAVLSHIL